MMTFVRFPAFIFITLVLFLLLLDLSSARKTSAGQVPLGVSRATGHAKAVRLAGPRISPTHRLEEQEKLKNKVYKQVAWKNKKIEEKRLNTLQQEELNLLTANDMMKAEVIDSMAAKVIKIEEEVEVEEIDDIKQYENDVNNNEIVSRMMVTKQLTRAESMATKGRPLFRKLLLKRKQSQ
jgi:hypothetical protein